MFFTKSIFYSITFSSDLKPGSWIAYCGDSPGKHIHEINTYYTYTPLEYAGVYLFLAHLSRRLIGELIVYPCSGVRPSSSTISKIFFSETAGPIVIIFHIHHLLVGGKNNCVFFCFDRIRTLVAMATYASHRLIMEKSENC